MKPSDKKNRTQKLQLFLSHNGVCSRRRAMQIIFDGEVTVNGNLVQEPSVKIVPGKDKICVKGKVVSFLKEEYIILHKPSGIMTTRADKFAPKTVIDLLPKELQHLFPVGRLDKDTEGLLLLTNDGDLANRLTHPKYECEKKYFVIIKGKLDLDNGQQIKEGVLLDDKKTAPAKLTNVRVKENQTELTLTITEGRKRQIRRMFEVVGHEVKYLKRLSQGPIKLGNLKIGSYRFLSDKEIKDLKEKT
ncbi:Ribosomal large subunit pseudouridine synthase B [hydrothermal vent metagenome]|uniref:Ribosomal large subunit pseudouridine synthase B n=1 Tax=hydrothermal vent metagenome TaxID=652676 RepID=A0A3B0TMP2_9ZZZZ